MIDAEFVHHMRQAEADLGLARMSLGLALSREPEQGGSNLRLLAVCLESVEGQLRTMRLLAETPVGGGHET